MGGGGVRADGEGEERKEEENKSFHGMDLKF
jgi:hypothetical protein